MSDERFTRVIVKGADDDIERKYYYKDEDIY